MKLRFILCLLILSSCAAYHHGSLSESSLTEGTSIVDFARGHAKVNRFLFWGGVNRDVLVADAKRNMLLNYPLEDGQFFNNYIVDFKEAFYFYGIHSTSVTITAEVASKESSDFLDNMREEASKKSTRYQLGQEVFFRKGSSKYIPAKVLSFENNKVVLGYFDEKEKYRIKRFPVDKIVPGKNSDLKQ